MKGLLKILPPFAPDYSGICSVLFELDGLVVIQDAGGCTGNFTCYDEPRWFGSSSAVFSSELREMDAILGDDDKFINRVREAALKLNRKFIAIIGSPAPMVIGTDYKAVAGIIARKTELPTLYFDANGIETYEIGISMANLAIANNLLIPNLDGERSGVNILGATPLDFGNGRILKDLKDLLEVNGCRINSTWGMGSGLEEVSGSLSASLNIVVSWSGLAAARLMEQEHGIPYVVGLPAGESQSTAFISRVLGKKSVTPASGYANDKSILILGEQVQANSMREALHFDSDYSNIKVASFFAMDEDFMQDGDVRLESESDLRRLVRDNSFEVVFGDPLYRRFFNKIERLYYLSIPHVAVSSRLFWKHDFSLIDGNWIEKLKRSEYLNPGLLVEEPIYEDLKETGLHDLS